MNNLSSPAKQYTATTQSNVANPTSAIPYIGEKEIEKEVLNCLMNYKNAVISAKSTGLTIDCFSDGKYRYIYETIDALSRDNQPIDPLSVIEQLRRMNHLSEAGGADCVLNIAIQPGHIRSLENYVLYLVEYDMRRKAYENLSKFINLLADDNCDIFKSMSDLLKELESMLEKNPIASTIQEMPEVVEKTLEKIKYQMEHKGELQGVTTGIKALDKITGGLKPGEVTVVSARTGYGKSSFMLHLGKCCARAGKKILLNSLEMTPEQNVTRLLQDAMEYDCAKWRTGDFTPEEFQNIKKQIQELAQWDIAINTQWNTDIDQLAIIVKTLCTQKRCDVVLIDYCQLVSPTKSKGNRTREQEVAEVSRVCKKLALTYTITVVLLSQLRRAAESHTNGRPQLSDLRESGAIEQDADVVILLDQPAKRGIMTFQNSGCPTENLGVAIVAKNRNGETGDVLYQHDAAMLHVTDFVPPREWLAELAKKQAKTAKGN